MIWQGGALTISPYPFLVTKIGSSDSWHIREILLVFFKSRIENNFRHNIQLLSMALLCHNYALTKK
jgi:hypothetical protein